MQVSVAELNIPTHERVVRFEDDQAVGFIAIHSTKLGPAFGGARLWAYQNEAEALSDALRLSEGMTHKNAFADLGVGGGKAALAPKRRDFSRGQLFRTLGRCVAKLGGAYITAEDVGTAVDDMLIVRQETEHVAGLPAKDGGAGGDPSPWTALGVFESMKGVVDIRKGRGLNGLTVAIQGLGNVGYALCGLLANAGAKLIVADAVAERASRASAEFGAITVDASDILLADADVLAPCALGGVLNSSTIPLLRSGMIVGAANNQLQSAEDADALQERAILYVPDYVVNAGGIINVMGEFRGVSIDEVETRVRDIGRRAVALVERSKATHRMPLAIAMELVEARLSSVRPADR